MPDPAGMLAVTDLRSDGPTQVALANIHGWVVWQFPKPRQGGLCAALHPPEVAFGWLPAIVDPETEQVAVYAEAGPFPTPEEAVAWIERA